MMQVRSLLFFCQIFFFLLFNYYAVCACVGVPCSSVCGGWRGAGGGGVRACVCMYMCLERVCFFVRGLILISRHHIHALPSRHKNYVVNIL